MEEWRNIKGFEGLYQVSNFGRIKSLGNKQNRKEKILRLYKDSAGYYQIKLYYNGNYNRFKVHRLVWEAFNGIIPNGLVVNHINEIKTDNRLSNLNLLSFKDNLNYGTANERKTLTRLKNLKSIIEYDSNGNIIRVWELSEIKNKLGIQHNSILEYT